MVTLEYPRIPIDIRYQRIKAAIDFIMAVLMLILLAPLLLVVAILIRMDSPGPAIYRQQRVGAHGRLFTMFKFRTMRVDAPCLSTEELHRLGLTPYTRLGPLLRKTSLDELPQLFNIFRGEMSFIGPRPALPSQVDVNSLRAEVGVTFLRPGITGLAQVSGRDDLDTESKVRYDAQYGRQLSLPSDLRVLALTAHTVMSARGNK